MVCYAFAMDCHSSRQQLVSFMKLLSGTSSKRLSVCDFRAVKTRTRNSEVNVWCSQGNIWYCKAKKPVHQWITRNASGHTQVWTESTVGHTYVHTTHACVHRHSYARTLAYTRTHIITSTLTCSHIVAYTNARTHIRVHTHTCTHTCAWMHAHKHARTRAHTHTVLWYTYIHIFFIENERYFSFFIEGNFKEFVV